MDPWDYTMSDLLSMEKPEAEYIENLEDVGDDPRVKALVRSVGPVLAPLVPEDATWMKNRQLLKLNLILCLTCLASSSVGYDNSLVNALQAFPEWKVDLMREPGSEMLGLIVVTLAIGGIVGNLIVPYIADHFGRLLVIRIGTVGMIAFSLGQTFVKSRDAYVVMRAFIGFSSAFLLQTVVVISEVSFPTYRGFFSCFYMVMYYAGSFLGAWVAYGARDLGEWSWKAVTIVQIAFPCVTLPMMFYYLPESPRWLISQGRVEEARLQLMKFHCGNDPRYAPLVEVETAEIVSQIEYLQGKKHGWMSLLQGRPNQWRSFISVTLGVFAQWNGVGVISYYLTSVLTSVGVTGRTEQTLINGFLQLWNYICAAFAAFNVDRIGRKPLFLWSTIGMLISYIIITALSATYVRTGSSLCGIGVIAFLFVYYGHYDIAFTPLVTAYPVEIWPFELRAKGVAVVHIATYAGLLFNQFVNPIALSHIAWKYYIVYIGVLCIMLAVIIFSYPETKGFSLEEVQGIFDGTADPAESHAESHAGPSESQVEPSESHESNENATKSVN